VGFERTTAVIATSRRNIVQIDEQKCDGCGQCVPSCAEGAIQIIEGKARLVSDIYCDGLGACLGTCPQGAISIVQREAAAFDQQAVDQQAVDQQAVDQQAVDQHVSAAKPQAAATKAAAVGAPLQVLSQTPGGGCPGTRTLADRDSRGPLVNWPVQLHLVPPHAPFLQNADLLLVADCVPLACADFHRRFVADNPLVIGCPKLDDGMQYVQKLAQMIRVAALRSLTVLIMEVPCCSGLLQIAQAAIAVADVDLPLRTVVVSRQGEELAAR
jgi:NAD-dependent dihydropyrimidine dehydrogenase PreA subunit